MTYERHSECILLAVTRLGKQSMILGFTWLDKHNPEIDFRARSVKMTRCLPHCCVGCQADRKAGRNARREDTERINTCWTGPFPAFVEDADEEDETKPTPEQLPDPEADFLDEPLEEGDESGQPDSFPRRNTFVQPLRSLNGSRKASDRIPNPLSASHRISVTSTPYSRRTLSMSYPEPSHGITPSNSLRTPPQKAARSTRFPPPNRRSWTPF